MPHLSSAIRAGSLLFLSGQLAFDEQGQVGGHIEAQTMLALKHQFALLAQYGLRPEHVVKVNAWLTQKHDFPLFDQAFSRAFGTHRPTRSTVISQLAIEGALVEIDLIASFELADG